MRNGGALAASEQAGASLAVGACWTKNPAHGCLWMRDRGAMVQSAVLGC